MATAQANARLWHRFKLVSAVKDIPEVKGFSRRPTQLGLQIVQYFSMLTVRGRHCLLGIDALPSIQGGLPCTTPVNTCCSTPELCTSGGHPCGTGFYRSWPRTVHDAFHVLFTCW